MTMRLDGECPEERGTAAHFGGDQVGGAKNVYNFHTPMDADALRAVRGTAQAARTITRYTTPHLDDFRVFVPPPGISRLRSRLEGGPVAAVRGPSGSGRTAAALDTLAGQGAQRFFDVGIGALTGEIDLAAIEAGSGLILDCGTEHDPAAARLNRVRVAAAGSRLADRSCWLVVILGHRVRWADAALEELTAARCR